MLYIYGMHLNPAKIPGWSKGADVLCSVQLTVLTTNNPVRSCGAAFFTLLLGTNVYESHGFKDMVFVGGESVHCC